MTMIDVSLMLRKFSDAVLLFLRIMVYDVYNMPDRQNLASST